MVTEDRGNKRFREEIPEAIGPSKQPKLGFVPQHTPEGGSNHIEIDGKTCTHAVAWPEDEQTKNLQPPPARPGPAAKEFPFTLDPFQRTAINCLEAGVTTKVLTLPSPQRGQANSQGSMSDLPVPQGYALVLQSMPCLLSSGYWLYKCTAVMFLDCFR